MKRIEYNYGVLLPIENLQPIDSPPSVEVQKHNPLLDLIFAFDEKGCLNGDIALYMGENTNPEIKQFITNELMRENVSDGDGLSLPNDVINKMRGTITDDDIAKFSRNHGESPEQYAYRIGKFFAEEKAKNVAKAKYQKEKERLESLGYNFD